MHRTAVALALLLLAGTGCGKGGEVVIDTKNSAGESVKIMAGATGTVALPATYPKDIPVPKDSTVAGSIAQGKDLSVTFRAKGTVAESVAFYQERLQAEGWTLKPVLELSGTSSILEGKKDKRKCTVMVTPGEGETVVMVQTSLE